MTIIKQRAVSAKIHAKHLRAYINDERALMRDVQNIARREAWFKEMDETREVAGHNTAARKGAKNTVMYHQVLAFLPEECDVNGGRLTPELCMAYAKEYAQTRYPNQQIVFALHRERCKDDGIERYAVHMAINRTDLETLKRLDEGTGAKAKRERAAAVRALDERWCLQQVEEGKPNSRIHRQQPRDVEKKMLEQGKIPIKTALRDACHRALRQARDMDEYRAMLDAEGISTRICRGKLYATDRSNDKYEFSLPRLDNRFNSNLLRACFARNNGDPAVQRINATIDGAIAKGGEREERVARARTEYLALAKERYKAYVKRVKPMEGRTLAEIPEFRLPRTSKEILDKETNLRVLEYARKAKSLRAELASDVVRKKKSGGTGGRHVRATTPTRAPEIERAPDRRNGER